MAKSASQLIFDKNKSSVLKAIRDHGPVSRVELSQLTAISAPTVTRLVNSLIADRLVRNTGMGTSRGGRPPMILEFDGDSSYVIGIDWGLTHIKGILSNLDGEVLFERDIPQGLSNNIEGDLERVKDLVRKLIGSAYVPADRLKGIGIAAAGYINKHSGTIEYSPVQKWHRINIKDPLQEEFGVPVHIDYVSRVMALSEQLYGQARGYDDFIFITVDYGMGAGLIVNGSLVQGDDGYSGEFGHTRIVPAEGYDSRSCLCGKPDCLAEYVSGRGIAFSAGERRAEIDPVLAGLDGDGSDGEITAKQVSLAAEKGDPVSREIFADAASMLGVAIANISNLLNPRAVILGGKLMRSDFYFKSIQDVFARNTLVGVPREIKVLRSELQDKTAVRGAVALVLEKILTFG
jgi:predicted NBD/HSP70 family sugar kinase